MIYPHVVHLNAFYQDAMVTVDVCLQNKEYEKLERRYQEFCRYNDIVVVSMTEDMIETLRAFQDGLTVDDLLEHNHKQEMKDEEHDIPAEAATIYTDGLPLLIEQIFGRGSMNKFTEIMDTIKENPKEALNIVTWIKESWPTWKKEIKKYQEEYGPLVEDITKTAGEVLEPVIDLPWKLLLGIGLREEIREEIKFRKKAAEVLDSVKEHFDLKNHPEELQID